MVSMDIYDWNCAELIHSYVDKNFDEFCAANIDNDISELQFAVNHKADFKDWASAYGYDIK